MDSAIQGIALRVAIASGTSGVCSAAPMKYVLGSAERTLSPGSFSLCSCAQVMPKPSASNSAELAAIAPITQVFSLSATIGLAVGGLADGGRPGAFRRAGRAGRWFGGGRGPAALSSLAQGGCVLARWVRGGGIGGVAR